MLDTVAQAPAFILAAAEGGKEEGGSFLVTPSLGLMVWTLIVFGLTLIVLWKLAFPQIAAALDKRQQAIEESIETAARTKVEADALLDEYRQRLADARAQADDIVARARKAGEQVEADALADARSQRDALLDQTKRDIDAETRRAIQDIRREVADLTILATEKVTKKSLSAADQDQLVQDALSELDFTTLTGSGAEGK